MALSSGVDLIGWRSKAGSSLGDTHFVSVMPAEPGGGSDYTPPPPPRTVPGSPEGLGGQRTAVNRRIMSLRKQTPSDFLKQIIGRPVVVKLNSGVDYRGVLACLDGYMNIAVEQTEEYVNGQLKNKYGDAFLRGNNVLYISTQKRKM
ncbi:unnamed protein product [Coregonus sp. 'balchen']|nr:unnamed protein product [Coregonus sp. 'balchen']